MSSELAKLPAQPVAALEPLREQVRIVQALSKPVTERYCISLQGKQYVQVAGATLIANAMGYAVREVEVKRVDFGGGISGWEATAEILDIETGTIIGRGSGIVTDDEKPWGGLWTSDYSSFKFSRIRRKNPILFWCHTRYKIFHHHQICFHNFYKIELVFEVCHIQNKIWHLF